MRSDMIFGMDTGFLEIERHDRVYAPVEERIKGLVDMRMNARNQPLDLIRLFVCNSRNFRIRTPVGKVVLRQVASVIPEPTARGGKLSLFR
jgi:hypothetical protein